MSWRPFWILNFIHSHMWVPAGNRSTVAKELCHTEILLIAFVLRRQTDLLCKETMSMSWEPSPSPADVSQTECLAWFIKRFRTIHCAASIQSCSNHTALGNHSSHWRNIIQIKNFDLSTAIVVYNNQCWSYSDRTRAGGIQLFTDRTCSYLRECSRPR